MARHPLGAPTLVGMLAVAALLAGCNNAWEWMADSESYDVLLADGRQALRDGNYDLALEKLGSAVEREPARGGARYYYAKAAVLAADLDLIDLVQTVTDSDNNGGAERIFEYETPTADRIYRVNEVVLGSLRPIETGEADSEGLRSADVDLDLAIAYTLRGILRLRDTNGDGRIDASDLSIADFALSGDGSYSLEGLQNIPPEDLNGMIDDLNDLLGSGGDLLDGADLGGIDSDELNDLIDSLGGDLSAFYVNTGLPGNPGEGDNDLDGQTDEECLNGLDDDGDGRTDEDARLLGC